MEQSEAIEVLKKLIKAEISKELTRMQIDLMKEPAVVKDASLDSGFRKVISEELKEQLN